MSGPGPCHPLGNPELLGGFAFSVQPNGACFPRSSKDIKLCLYVERRTMDGLVANVPWAGDPPRLPLLLLLRQAELTVSELIEIVGQSQPRVSRHLKLLGEAGLLERFKE